MQRVWKKLAFQQGDGGLPHEPELRAGHCQGEAFPPELQDVRRGSDGGAQHHLGEHRSPPGQSGEEDKDQMLP